MSDIRQFPETSRVYNWAKSYARIYAKDGAAAAGTYARDVIPEQFHHQIEPLMQEEYLKLKEQK